MTEYSRSAKGSFTQAATGNNVAIYLPFQPNLVKLTNYTAYANFAASDIPWAVWDPIMGQGTAAVGYVGTGPVLSTAVVTANGISTFAAGLALQFGAKQQIASIAKASPTVVTTASAHGYNVGDVVMLEGLYQSATTGMPQMSGMPFQITAVGSTTTFTVTWNSNQSNYTALSASPTGAFVMKVLYPFLYLPGVNFIEAINTTTNLITTTTNHNYVVGQQVAFRIPTQWGSTQLNSLPDVLIPGSPIYYYVTAVNSNTTFTVAGNLTAVTAYTSNVAVTAVPGLTPPQVVAVGDVNTGGVQYTGGNLYPSPIFPTFSGGVSTINGPAIQGAFVNNTRQGFVIGSGNASYQGTPDTASHLSGETSDVIYWEASYSELAMP
jgi:hypothetical protein